MSEQRHWAPSGALGPHGARQALRASFGVEIVAHGRPWGHVRQALIDMATDLGIGDALPRVAIHLGVPSGFDPMAFDEAVLVLDHPDPAWASWAPRVASIVMSTPLGDVQPRLALELAGVLSQPTRREDALQALHTGVAWAGTEYAVGLSFLLGLAGVAAHTDLRDQALRFLDTAGRWQQQWKRPPVAVPLADERGARPVELHRRAVARCAQTEDFARPSAPVATAVVAELVDEAMRREAISEPPISDASSMTDHELWRRAADHDHGSYAALVARFFPPMYQRSLSILRDRTLAEDAAQMAMVRVLTDAPRRPDVHDVRAYVIALATHVALDLLRSQHRRERHLERLESLAGHAQDMRSSLDGLVDAEATVALRGAIESLDPMTRAAVLLRYQDELPWTEIAASLDQPVDTLRMRVARALPQLRTALERKGHKP